ncbi:MAG: hypothetical protein HYU28_05790 [Actinobacteria bacterium]|nr:hypothetical protein [Actinomycetota bacterium]
MDDRAVPEDPTIQVVAWADPITDVYGIDPRSLYAETFWLPPLGPTALLLLRHLAQRFDAEGDSLSVSIPRTAVALGLGPRTGANSPLVRAFERLVHFDFATASAPQRVAVRRRVPPVKRHHVRRLPEHLWDAHEGWLKDGPSPGETAVANARRIALALTATGADVNEVEARLAALRFAGALCFEAARWALEAVGRPTPVPA